MHVILYIAHNKKITKWQNKLMAHWKTLQNIIKNHWKSSVWFEWEVSLFFFLQYFVRWKILWDMQFKYIYTVYTQEIWFCNSLTQFFFNLIFNLGQGNQFKSTVTYYKFKIDVVGE